MDSQEESRRLKKENVSNIWKIEFLNFVMFNLE